jgi:hypothetical protein
VVQGDIGAQVRQAYEEFNGDQGLRTCSRCGYLFPEPPLAERLGFLETKQ